MALSTHRRARFVGVSVWVICLVASITLLALPVVGDAWLQSKSEEVIASVDTACIYEASEAQFLLDEAKRYNDELGGITNETSRLSYEDQLAFEGEEAMGWVEIPRINVRLPVYHGADAEELASGVGHVEGTSLPVGGTSSNCALAAHTGMSFARMFDDIGALTAGDLVIVHVLGEELVYEVEESFVVWPWETEALEIEPGRDLVTLVTCTPYGVNDHRLIVRAARAQLEVEPDSTIENVAQSIDTHSAPLVIALLIAIVAGGIYALQAFRKRKR